MIRRDREYTNLNAKLPEMRTTRDPIAEEGRSLRIRREEYQPQSDLKYWR